jgi:hypothetical protein
MDGQFVGDASVIGVITAFDNDKSIATINARMLAGVSCPQQSVHNSNPYFYHSALYSVPGLAVCDANIYRKSTMAVRFLSG